MGDPKKIFESRDIEAAALYAKRAVSDAADLYPCLQDDNGYLCVNMTVGTVSLSSTASTITNAVGNPVNVSLTSTVVTIESAGLNVTPTTTASTITNEATNPVPVTGNINIATATLGTVTITGTVTPSTTASTVTNSVSTIAIVGRTLTGSTGSLTATNGTISLTPTNRIKVYAISLTTTCPTEVIAVFNSGGVANGLELWRATLMAPAGANSGLNLAVSPPNFLFASRSGTAVSLSLSSAVLVHYSISYFDEV